MLHFTNDPFEMIHFLRIQFFTFSFQIFINCVFLSSDWLIFGSTYMILFTTNEWIRLFIGFGHRGKNKLFSDFVFRNLEERSFAFGKADSDRDRSRLWRFESVEHDVDFEIELPSIGDIRLESKRETLFYQKCQKICLIFLL